MEISSLSVREQAEIIATLHAIDRPKEFQCNKCLTELKGPAGDRRRVLKGCTGPSFRPMLRDQGLSYLKCPGNFFSNQVGTYMAAFDAYEEGTMPYPGAFFEQPAKIFEIFGVIRAYKRDKLEKQDREQKLRDRLSGHGRRNKHRR